MVKGFNYDAYGKTTETGNSGFINSTAYTGAVIDEATGLYYMNARYYDPVLGRFLTEDSVRNGNLFSYCGGDPVDNIDSSGHGYFKLWGINWYQITSLPCTVNYYYLDPTGLRSGYKTRKYTVKDGDIIGDCINCDIGVRYPHSTKTTPAKPSAPPTSDNGVTTNPTINDSYIDGKNYEALETNWRQYIKIKDNTYNAKSKEGCLYNSNLNPEFIGRLAALCKYMDTTITVTEGYRRHSEQGDTSFTSWHELGLAIDTGKSTSTNVWLYKIGYKSEILQRFGLDNSVPNKDKYGNLIKTKYGTHEYWHIQALEVVTRGISGKQRRSWTETHALYSGLKAGWNN